MIHVVPEALQVRDEDHPQSMGAIQQKAEDLDVLVHLMKDKLKFLSRQRKVQLLTIVPHSWSIHKGKEEFQVSGYVIRKARKLASEKGILELPDQEQGKVITEEAQNSIRSFYCDDKFSRQLPGKKDFVS